MRFTPKDENELSHILPEGEYDFEIMSAEHAVSRETGKDMIKLVVGIWDGDRVVCRIFDYLLEAVAYKLRHCCDACGLLDQYNSGNVEPEMFIGRTGRCKIVIDKDKTKTYPDKNAIRDYVKRTPKPQAQTATAPAPRPVQAAPQEQPPIEAFAGDPNDGMPF